METLLPDGAARSALALQPECEEVILADGRRQNLAALGPEELLVLQWEQERAFARQILAAPKGSTARAETTRLAYETVTRIFIALRGAPGGHVSLGLHPRHERLVLELLARQRKRGIEPRFFEIGYGSGVLLKRVSDAGYPVAGIEVSALMHQQAGRLLGAPWEAHLHLGGFLDHEFSAADRACSLVYWNDVFEHIPPDELGDYLRRIHALLVPGGQLITITPNWHMRPWDITRAFCPPRTKAAGLHLKEYTLGEVRERLVAAGFRRVATPLFVTRQQIVLAGRGLVGPKRLLEPALEWLPLWLTQLACRGLALSTTIATK